MTEDAKTTLINYGEPLHSSLQGGYENYRDGLLLADGHSLSENGGWIVKHKGVAANVHPILSDWDNQLRHEGRLVYGVRFWVTPWGQPPS